MGLTHTFQIGQLVSFNRNPKINSDSTPIISQVPYSIDNTTSEINDGNMQIKQGDLIYVVENDFGWIPNSIRKTKYNLDENKKYLFVSESELTLITN